MAFLPLRCPVYPCQLSLHYLSVRRCTASTFRSEALFLILVHFSSKYKAFSEWVELLLDLPCFLSTSIIIYLLILLKIKVWNIWKQSAKQVLGGAWRPQIYANAPEEKVGITAIRFRFRARTNEAYTATAGIDPCISYASKQRSTYTHVPLPGRRTEIIPNDVQLRCWHKEAVAVQEGGLFPEIENEKIACFKYKSRSSMRLFYRHCMIQLPKKEFCASASRHT